MVYEKTNYANVNSIPSITAVANANEMFGHLRIRSYRHVLANDAADMTETENTIKDRRDTVVKTLKKYEALVSDDKDKQLLAENVAVFEAYFQGVEK